jgi:hypothetical protein
MNKNETYVMYIKDYNLFGSRQTNGSVSIMTILYASLLSIMKIYEKYEKVSQKLTWSITKYFERSYCKRQRDMSSTLKDSKNPYIGRASPMARDQEMTSPFNMSFLCRPPILP